MPPLHFVGQSATARSSNAANLRLLNGYAELNDHRQGKGLAAIYGTPGLTRFCTLPGTGGLRCLYTSSQGRCYAVQGAGLYELFTAGTFRWLGSLDTTTGPVDADDNGMQAVFVDGPNGYSLDLNGNTLTQLGGDAWRGAVRVGFLDQRLLFNAPDSQQFFWTELAGVTLDALDVASAESSPDRLVALVVKNREIWLLGTTSIEVWFDTGALFTPFQRVQGAAMEMGCVAAHSVQRLGDVLYWLGGNAESRALVCRAQGYNVEPIATPAVALAMQGYSRVDDAVAYTYEQDRHAFYVLSFPTANATWAYDASTGLWSERAYRDATTGLLERHRASTHCVAFGRHLVGDWEDGRVYTLGLDTYTDDGAPILLEVIPPPLYDQTSLNGVLHRRLHVDCETGVGLDGAVVPGSDSQLLLQWSNDGGHTWGQERTKPLGALGRYATQVEWYQLGMAKDRRYRLRISDPVKRAITGLYVDVEGLTT